jgi:Beta-1,3-glucanase
MKRSDFDRRAFLAALASTGALAACARSGGGSVVPSALEPNEHSHATSPTDLVIENKTTYPNTEVFYYVWGLDTASNTFQYLLPNGTTKQWTTAVGNNFGIQLSKTAKVKIPKLVAAEIYVSLGTGKPNFLNGQASQKEPVAPNAWNPNAFGSNFNKLFDHIEFTYIDKTLGLNTTTVDMLSLPFTFAVTAGGKTGSYGFDPKKKMSALFKEFEGIADFKNLLVKGGKNKYLRVIAPGHGIENSQQKLSNGFPVNYLQKYINDCWTYYKTNTLSVYTDDEKTLLATGQVNANGLFVFKNTKGVQVTWNGGGKQWNGFPKPTSLGAFECAANEIPSPSDASLPVTAPINVFGACGKNIGAALNRTILLKSKKQPFCQTAQFYKNAQTNTYSRILHEYALDGKFYGFAYDDLCGYSNYVAFNNATQVKLTVGSLD